MQAYGIRADQVAQIRGFSDQSLRLASKPEDPTNRRISIIIQYLNQPKAAANAPADKGDNHGHADAAPKADAHGAAPSPPADGHAKDEHAKKPAAGH
jgi:chemotaxis protein MotB